MFMAEQHFGTDGIRGPVGQGLLTPEGAEQVGRAVGMTFAEPGDVVTVGHDPRNSSPWLARGVAEGLNAVGVDAEVVGVIPTPGLAHATRTSDARAGVMITASHNPVCDNGMKVFSAEGGKLPDTAEAGINDRIGSVLPDRGRRGRIFEAPERGGAYVDFLAGTAEVLFDGLHIGLDTANGATSTYAEQVFSRLGAVTVPLFNKPDGHNINDGCGAMHPGVLQQAVTERNLDMGLAFDGDGDRLMLVDATGRVLNGDNTLHILALGNGERRTVGTVMANMGLEVELAKHGIKLDRTKVGDRYVLERLIAEGLNLGGEQSGHVIMLDKLPTGDGILAAIHTVQAVRNSGETLTGWGNMWTPFPQTLVNVRLNGSRDAVMAHPDVARAVADVETAYAGMGRVVLRPSGTEPLVRVMVEGEDAAAAAGRIADVIKRISVDA
jgi:phosphoglucosamine mutase